MQIKPVVDVLSDRDCAEIIVDTEGLAKDFVKVAAIAGIVLLEGDVEVEHLPSPHSRPKNLPAGRQAVYVFCTRWNCLKVGKVGPRSQARYTSQHYNPRSANSNLSLSLLNCDRSRLESLLRGALPAPTEESVGGWLEEHTTRYNFLIDADQPPHVLTLLEAFLQCRLKPVFEQRQ